VQDYAKYVLFSLVCWRSVRVTLTFDLWHIGYSYLEERSRQF